MARREEIPDHFDWRPYNVVTPVKSQFKCGSCWAFATVGTVESAYALGTGELRSLSEQQLLDCNLENNACDGGDVDKALRYVYDEGLMREYDYPYVAHRQDTCQLRGETTRIKAAVFLHQDEASIIDWLLHYGPVNVGINVTADMKAYKGGVYTPDKWECENKIIGTHSINIVGYGTWNATNQKYWIVKNSWGQDIKADPLYGQGRRECKSAEKTAARLKAYSNLTFSLTVSRTGTCILPVESILAVSRTSQLVFLPRSMMSTSIGMDFSMKPPFIDEEEEDFFEITPKRKRRTRGLKWLAAATLCFVAIYFIYGFIAQLATDHRFTASWLWWWKKSALSDGTVELHYLDSFEKFMKRYERQYENSEEVLNRLKTFIQNMNNAKRLNDANSAASARFGENIFADWTDDEFENILMSEDALRELRKMANFIRPANKKTLKTEEVPDYFDWRPFNVVTPVKSQCRFPFLHNTFLTFLSHFALSGRLSRVSVKCGSCWAFATVAVVESAYAIANGELRSLSEQQLLDCDLNDNACDGGRVENALQYVYENGLMNEDDYPYVAHRQDACYLRGATARIKSAVFLHQDEASIIDWLLHYGPVNVVINTTADLKLYTGGVYTPQKWECENKIIGLHALSIVGYGIWNETNEKYWIVKNSWGQFNTLQINVLYFQRYGVEHGYVYFARGINACGIEDQPMGVIA
ncbi:unnamed protein product [Toxocara canis]|uniref:Cathepsin L-like proteinase n=1 Tax=Toxocara canis TaxID=6265 RepID=A0A183UKH6_TOXCA|nr:unnamed protein product [Toxocara canis]